MNESLMNDLTRKNDHNSMLIVVLVVYEVLSVCIIGTQTAAAARDINPHNRFDLVELAH